ARRKVTREHIVAARRVGHEIVCPLHQPRDLRLELVDRRPLEHLEARCRQLDAAPPRRILAVFKVTVESALARVKVDSCDTPAKACERYREMHGAGRFARPPL